MRSDFEYVISSGDAEEYFSRGILDLTEDQVSGLLTQDVITLSEEQFAKLGGGRRQKTLNWIAPLEAVHLLAPSCGGDATAKALIAERFLDGAIYSTFLWSCECIDFGTIPTRRPKVNKEPLTPGTAFSVRPTRPTRNLQMLGGAFRHFSDDWERDKKRWNWTTGTFCGSLKESVTISQSTESGEIVSSLRPLLFVVHGVRFDQTDVEKLLPSGSSTNAHFSQKHLIAAAPILEDRAQKKPAVYVSRRGPKKHSAWDPWIAELLMYANAHGLGSKLSANQLHTEICDRIAKRNPQQEWLHFDTVEATIRFVRQRWNDAVENGELKKRK